MPSTDLRLRFVEEYKGDIKDPVLTMLLDTLDAYLKDVQTQSLLTAYAQRSDQVSDAFFEVLRRHLFGQMFPGPAFAIAQASLREVNTAMPLLLKDEHYFSLQDQEGNKVLFAPQHPCWIVPSFTNDVRVQANGQNLSVGINVVTGNISKTIDGVVSVFASEVDPIVVERLRCRLPSGGSHLPERTKKIPSPVRSQYPGTFGMAEGFFQTPYETRFLNIPFEVLCKTEQRSDGIVWLMFEGLGELAPQLERRLTINAFPMWNMVRQQALPVPLDNFRYTMSIADHASKETIIFSAMDYGSTPPIEYVEAAKVMDPGYPFQFTAAINNRRDEVTISCSPPPSGDLKVEFTQYDLGEACLNIVAGRTFGLFQGIDERIKTVTSLTPTHRIHALNDKQLIWDTFRSLLASRNRWLTKEDLRAAVSSYPAFRGRVRLFATDDIKFVERVGRVNGFLTPFTEIVIPVNDPQLLIPVERQYFERQLEQYLRNRTVHGNFVRVVLVSPDTL